MLKESLNISITHRRMLFGRMHLDTRMQDWLKENLTEVWVGGGGWPPIAFLIATLLTILYGASLN